MKKKHKKQAIKGPSIVVLVCIIVMTMCWIEACRNYGFAEVAIEMQTSDGSFSNISQNKLLDIISKDTCVVVFVDGNEDISKIKKALYINSVNYRIKNIYFYDVANDKGKVELDESGKAKVTRQATDFYNKLINILGDFAEVYAVANKYGDLVNTGYKTIYTPFTIFVKNGEIKYSYYLTSNDVDLIELRDIYSKGFELIEN